MSIKRQNFEKRGPHDCARRGD